MTRPRWLALDGAAMAELRETPAIQMLIEWLEWERERARETVLSVVAAPMVGGADPRLRAGAALTFDHILRSLKTPVAIAEMDDEEFVDPARRPNYRKDESDAQV